MLRNECLNTSVNIKFVSFNHLFLLLLAFTPLFVCLIGNKIQQKLQDGFPRNSVEGLGQEI